ncbi:flagellar assembly protein A [Sulfurimonas sp.]
MAEIEKKRFKTKNIKEALTLYAEDNLIPLAECDFKIEKIDTYIKSNATGEFELFAKELQEKYKNKQRILNEHVAFHQIYTIVAMPKEKSNIELEYVIDFGKYATHPKLILSPNSRIDQKAYKPLELLKALFVEFNKIKAYNKILINIFDEDMKKALKVLVKYIYSSKFVKKVKIPLFNGIEPIVSRESKLIFWFQEKENKGQVIEVEEDEVLVEYKKPIYGENGFNAYGENLDGGVTTNSDDFKAKIDTNSVYIEEDDNSKKYISKHRGYIHYDGNFLSVDNKIKLQELSRNRELLDSDEENNIEVIVEQRDTTKDSVGEGVELKSETINIEGFVGANSVLEAINLDIKGATHQDSSQYAKFAKINRHKGTLRCHEAKVALLEGGVIHATKVDVEASLSGSIYAQDVTIGHVKSNLKIYASNSITIRLVSGEDNTFTINYRDIPVLQSKIELIQRDIEELREKLSQAKRHSLEKVKIFQDKINLLKEEQKAIQSSYKDAKISVEQPFVGLNHIIFTIDNEHKIHYKTQARLYTPFYLEVQDNTVTLHPVAKSITIK